MKALILPTWLIYRAVHPWLPDGHAWANRRPFNLEEWTRHSTSLNFQFAAVMWVATIVLMICTISIYAK